MTKYSEGKTESGKDVVMNLTDAINAFGPDSMQATNLVGRAIAESLPEFLVQEVLSTNEMIGLDESVYVDESSSSNTATTNGSTMGASTSFNGI